MAKKKYSVIWENDEAVAFEIDGARYKSLDQIPNRADRLKMTAIVNASAESDPDQPPLDSYPIEKIILNIFTGVAILMLIIAAISAYSAIQTIAREESAPGRVVDVVVRREYINEQDRIVEEYYYPVVQFTAQDGRRREAQMSTGSNWPDYEKGDEVTVLYDPDHPLDARIKSFGSAAVMWILPGITGILGICFLGAVLLVRRVISREAAAE